ncbi:MAG TPA: peptidoglycan-binding domain-containing protein [Coleofasciculaceae cyanobacterium]
MQTSSKPTPATTPCHRMPVLRRNDRQTQPDEMVAFLQRRLNAYNFPLKIDGFFGAKTEAAVTGLQRRGSDHDSSILVDGIVGPQTWEGLAACLIIREQ